MRSSRSYVSGLETSGDLGPPPSPCCGPHGAGPTGRCVLSGMHAAYELSLKTQGCWRPARLRSAKNLNVQPGACLGSFAMPSLPPMIRNYFLAIAIVALCIAAATARAQDGAALQEIRDLRAMVEKQSKQIDALTEQVARLNHALANKAAGGNIPTAIAVTPAPAAEFSAETPKDEPPAGKRHVVVKGETLTSIAKQYNMPVADLQKANKGIDERKLQIGQTLIIPIQTAPESTT